ncbi:hypothetical protein LTR74_013438 [Friedmanniomyces endolithicus]|nr:hypothetical protein LTR74_013438 [Friedmanniomyces endolithicus]
MYDTIIDSCTHDVKTDTDRRRHGSRTALLRTCRAVHEDAVQVLYDNMHFELVVLAGVPRPYKVWDSHVIHPGRKPDGKRYEKRLVCFLKALGGGAHLRSLGILVACQTRYPKQIAPEGIEAFNLIATAFETHVIAEPKTPRYATLLFELESNDVPYEF